MKFKFEELDYQTKAINSVVDLFNGQETSQSTFTVENNMHQLGIAENLTPDGYSVGIGNRLDITEDELFKNMQAVQLKNGLAKTLEKSWISCYFLGISCIFAAVIKKVSLWKIAIL